MNIFDSRSLRRAGPRRGPGDSRLRAAITVSPKVMARPCGLLVEGEVPPPIATLTRSIGVRDIASAAALALAVPGVAMSGLTATRVVSDVADAIWLSQVAAPTQRRKVLAVTSGWAALQMSVATFVNRRQPHQPAS